MSQYIDTSVLAAYYCPEPLSAKAQKLLTKVDRPVISSLTEVELFSAVARKARGGELEAESARRIMAQFRSHIAEDHFRLVPVDGDHYVQAREWLAEMATPLRSLDALHLAVALSGGFPIATADGPFAKAARHYGVEVRYIRP